MAPNNAPAGSVEATIGASLAGLASNGRKTPVWSARLASNSLSYTRMAQKSFRHTPQGAGETHTTECVAPAGLQVQEGVRVLALLELVRLPQSSCTKLAALGTKQ